METSGNLINQQTWTYGNCNLFEFNGAVMHRQGPGDWCCWGKQTVPCLLSQFQFIMLANCVVILFIWVELEKYRGLPLKIKWFKRGMPYPMALSGGDITLLLLSVCRPCCCSYPKQDDGGEKARGVVPPPGLRALAVRGTVGTEVGFLRASWEVVGPSFLPPPPPKNVT